MQSLDRFADLIICLRDLIVDIRRQQNRQHFDARPPIVVHVQFDQRQTIEAGETMPTPVVDICVCVIRAALTISIRSHDLRLLRVRPFDQHMCGGDQDPHEHFLPSGQDINPFSLPIISLPQRGHSGTVSASLCRGFDATGSTIVAGVDIGDLTSP